MLNGIFIIINRLKYVVLMQEQYKKVAIIKSEGESTAAKLIDDSTKKAGPGIK